jgi:hypothetical protein
VATKKQIVALADQHNIRVEFDFYSENGFLIGETRLTAPEGRPMLDGSSGLTLQADGTYAQHLGEVWKDLKQVIREIADA